MASKTARKREKLFDDYSKRLAKYTGNATDSVVCPICLQSFGRDALLGANPKLTLGHVLPESLGGGFCTLSCAPCNNDFGSDLESHLVNRFRAEDAVKGVGKMDGRLEGEFGSIGVEYQSAPHGDSWTVFIIEKQTDTRVLRKLDAALDAPADDGVPLVAGRVKSLFQNRPNRVAAALYQSAYLLMFAYFGYEFSFDPRFEKLRLQILNPDEPILPGKFEVPPDTWTNEKIPEGRTHAVMFVKSPNSYIMPVFRLRPKGGISRVLGVPIPGLEAPSWPTLERQGKIRGVLVRFRADKDDGTRPRLLDLWELAKRMP